MPPHVWLTLSSSVTRALMRPYAVSAAAALPASSWKPMAGALPAMAAEPMLLVMMTKECRKDTTRPCAAYPDSAAHQLANTNTVQSAACSCIAESRQCFADEQRHLAVGQAAVLQNLQQHVQHIRVRLQPIEGFSFRSAAWRLLKRWYVVLSTHAGLCDDPPADLDTRDSKDQAPHLFHLVK